MIALNKEEILELHSLAIQEFGGSFGVRDEGLLESAVYMPYLSLHIKDPLIRGGDGVLCNF